MINPEHATETTGVLAEEPPEILEERLILGLQPIRQFVLAQALHHFMATGIQGAIAAAHTASLQDLARQLHLRENRLRGFLRYLANEGYVELLDDGSVRLTASGKEIADFRPWYTLLVGGYAPSFLQLSSTLREDGPYAQRDAHSVGVGACGISHYDSFPIARRLLERIPGHWRTVVDLGCGDGSYLIHLCRALPDIRGIGLDPDPRSVAAAARAAERHGIADRISVRVGGATPLPDLSDEEGPFCFLTAFVLQEVLEQEGREAIVELLTSAFTRHPDAHWIVIEVDDREDDPAVMEKPMALAYYNPYFLIHHLTEQKLERADFWRQLFQEVGLRVKAVEVADPSYDSLGLKMGFLLSRADTPARG